MHINDKTILIDLDGVLNSYNGVFNKDIIPKPKQGVEKFLKELSQHAKLYIFTTRKKSLVLKWLKTNDLDKYFTDITNKKLPAYLYIDDRAICFNGNYNDLLNKIYNFNVYWENTKTP